MSTDAGDVQTLTFGYDPGAMDNNFDEQFLEEQQPPLPPGSIFDARLIDDDVPPTGYGEGLLVDIRAGLSGFDGTKEHEIQLQPGDGASSVTFAWTLPAGVTGTLEDVVTDGGQVSESMAGSGSYTLTNLDIEKLYVTLNYSGEQSSVNIQSRHVDGSEDGPVSFANTGVDIGFSGVGSAGTVALTKFRTGPDGTDNISESNVSEYRYVLEPGDVSFDSATLQLADSTLAGMDDPSAVQVYRRDSPGSGSFQSVSTSASGDGTEVVATTESFGEFVLASNSEPLPVALTHFAARRDGQAAMLRWRTAGETRNVGFEVQHRAPAAEAFADVGFVDSRAADGTTSQSQSYRFAMDDLAPGTHQFRLRQVDSDGTADLSAPVSLTVDMRRALRLLPPSPNPVHTTARLRFGVRSGQAATVQLYNVLGQRVAMLYDGTPVAGRMEEVRLGADMLERLPSGTYFVRLEAGGKSRTRRLTIAH